MSIDAMQKRIDALTRENWQLRRVEEHDRETMEFVVRCMTTHDRSGHHDCCIARLRRRIADTDRAPLVDEHERLDGIYRHVDGLFRGSSFDVVDGLLKGADVESMDIVTMLAYVSITRVAHGKLPSRAEFVDRVRERLKRIAPDRWAQLLGGLERP